MKIIADLDDLELEYFLRMRERKAIVWKTKTGKEIPIQDMNDNHLLNTIKMINKNEDEIWNCQDISDLT